MKIKNGLVDSRLIKCPVCDGESVTISGYESDGRELVIHMVCNCSAMFVYEYIRTGPETLFQIKLVSASSEPLA